MALPLELSISQLKRGHTHLLAQLTLQALASTMLMSRRLGDLSLLRVIVHAAFYQVQLLSVGE